MLLVMPAACLHLLMEIHVLLLDDARQCLVHGMWETKLSSMTTQRLAVQSITSATVPAQRGSLGDGCTTV